MGAAVLAHPRPEATVIFALWGSVDIEGGAVSTNRPWACYLVSRSSRFRNNVADLLCCTALGLDTKTMSTAFTIAVTFVIGCIAARRCREAL